MYYLNNPTKKKPEPKKFSTDLPISKTVYIPNSWSLNGTLTWATCKPLLEQQGSTVEEGINGKLIVKFIPDNDYPFAYIPKYGPKKIS